MLSLREFAGQELCWMRPHFFQSAYELRAGDEVLATVRRVGTFKTYDVAVAEGQQWTFRRAGSLWKSWTAIYPGEVQEVDEQTQPIATYTRVRGGGRLTFSDGRSYNWTTAKRWRWRWAWTGPDEVPLLTMKTSKQLTIAPEAINLPELPLLVLFAFHLMKTGEEQAAASAAAASAGASL
jgi:hypothetical protein